MYKIEEIIAHPTYIPDGTCCDVDGCQEEADRVIDIESSTYLCKQHVQELAQALMKSISREASPVQNDDANRT